MSADLEWVDAPPRRWSPRTRPLIDAEQEAELRARPGRWAKVRSFPGPSSAHQARKRWKDGPGHLLLSEWEVQGRKFGDGSSALFVRFVGADAEVEGRVPDQGPGGEPAPSDSGTGDPVGPVLARPQEPVPEPAAELLDVDDDDEDDAAYEEQVAVIDGVCGPCRRLRCFMCAVPDTCACARPTHPVLVRSTA